MHDKKWKKKMIELNLIKLNMKIKYENIYIFILFILINRYYNIFFILQITIIFIFLFL